MLQGKLMVMAGIGAGVVLAIGVIFYFALRNTRTDVSQKAPYAHWLGTDLTLQQQAFLIKNEKQFAVEAAYKLVVDKSGYEEAIALPNGTKIKLNKATHYHKGVSGVTHSLVTGVAEVTALNKNIEFEYYWGNYHVICMEQPCNYWTYPQAVWQHEPDTARYY